MKISRSTTKNQRNLRDLLYRPRTKSQCSVGRIYDYIATEAVKKVVDPMSTGGLKIPLSLTSRRVISLDILKQHLRSICEWLEWIEFGYNGDYKASCVTHAKLMTRNVGFK